MLKQLFITYFLLTTIVSYCQQQRLSDFYPSAGKVDKDIIGNAQFLTTGCAEGNCENGNGKFVVVKFVDQGSYKEQYFGHLSYTIYNGEFSGEGSSFKGQCLQLIVKATMKKGKKTYTPDERQPDFSKAKLVSAGSFRKKRFEKSSIVQDAYVKHGTVQVFEWENKYNYTDYQSISGYYSDDKVKYAHIVYPDNYQMGTKWFTGIVTTKGKPVMGIRQTTKGQIENYRPYEQLAGDFANKLYDTTLLLALVKKDVNNSTLSFSIPDDAEIFFSNQNNTRIKKYTTDSGFIIQPDSKIAEPNYTGPGIFYTNSGKLYAGQFSNGKPHGEGWLFVEGDSEDPTLSYKEHNMYGQFVAGKILNGWYVAADHIYFNSPNRIISKTDLAAEWAGLQKKAESGDAKAMYDFAKKYYSYDAIEPNTLKALEWLEKAARADYMPAITELADIYSGESASYRSKDKFAADKEKQAYWAGVICKKDKVLANQRKTIFDKSYYQIYWGYYYYYLNHWDREYGRSELVNTPFVTLNKLTPDKEKYYKWVNDEIKREAATGNYSVRVSNYTLQPLTLINDSNTTFNVVAYHYGKLPESLEFSISRFDQTVKEENNQRITSRSRNALVCTFDKDDKRYTGLMSKRACNNGSLAYIFKNEKYAADYFFNLTPVNKPEMKVYENRNRQGFDILVDYDIDVLWAIFIKR